MESAPEVLGIARKIVANMTSESWTEIPHAVMMYDADVTKLLVEHKKLNAGVTDPTKKITINTLMMKCMSEGLKAAPRMNTHFYYRPRLLKGYLTYFDNIDVSMPMIFHTGEMMTINVRDVGNKSMTQITEYLADVVRRSKQTQVTQVMYDVGLANTIMWLKKGRILRSILKIVGANTGRHKVKQLKGKAKKEYYAIPETERLTPKDIEQGTTTISNLGSVYREHKGSCALLEIIPPQTTAFGLGAIQKKPVVVTGADGKDTIEIHSILPITIAFDHRVLDYDHIVPFMKKMEEILQDPSVIHQWK